MMNRIVLIAANVFSLMFFGSVLFGQGLTPESPQVARSVQKAVEFLKTNGVRESRLGGRALAAMALVKAGVDPEHPFIAHTISDIKKAVASDGTITITDHIYTAGIIVLFLGELDTDLYRRELDAFCRYLHKNQRRDGAWTYLTSGTADNYPSGDMSMTQYGAMALWTLHQFGFNVSGENANRLGRWLSLAQHPDGAYGYQTRISDGGKNVSRDPAKLSMTAAGMASVYLCYDLFGYNGKEARNIPEDEIPDAFSAVNDFMNGETRFQPVDGYRFTVRENMFKMLQQRGNIWLDKHFFPVTTQTEYFYYYLYAFERYAAFRELAEKKHHESPPWYDKTAVFLLSNQKENGCWQGNIGEVVDTAYAVLFLLRSTNRTFEKIRSPNRYGGGNLLGGRGLPKLTDQLKIEDGQVISLSEIADSGRLMDNLADLEETDEKALAQLAELPADEVEELLQKNKTKMKRLIGHENAERRHAVVKMFAKSGDVSNAPALIYALTDPNPEIAQAALDALNRLARIPVPEKLPTDPRQLNRLIDHWKEWYRKIDPDVLFEER